MISLSYRFARIFPLLEEHYIEKLKQAQMMEKKLTATKEEATTKTQEWRNCLKLYVECEYMTRATIIVEKIGLDVLLSNDWLQTFEVNFCGLLNALVCNDTSLSLK